MGTLPGFILLAIWFSRLDLVQRSCRTHKIAGVVFWMVSPRRLLGGLDSIVTSVPVQPIQDVRLVPFQRAFFMSADVILERSFCEVMTATADEPMWDHIGIDLLGIVCRFILAAECSSHVGHQVR
jgi:hypothetical protein